VFKATAFKAKDLQKKQGQTLGTNAKVKAKKYSRPTLRTSKSRFHSDISCILHISNHAVKPCVSVKYDKINVKSRLLS